MAGDTLTQFTAVLFQLCEPHISRLDADIVLFEIFQNMMITLPVIVQLVDLFLIVTIPGRKNLLLCRELVALLLREGRGGRLLPRIKIPRHPAREQEHRKEQPKHALTRYIMVQQNEQHDDDRQ